MFIAELKMQDLGSKGSLTPFYVEREREFQQFLWSKQEIKEDLKVAASRNPDLPQEWLHLIERKVQKLLPSHPLIFSPVCQRNRKAELGFEFLLKLYTLKGSLNSRRLTGHLHYREGTSLKLLL